MSLYRLRSRLRLPGWFTHPATVEERNARDVLVDGIGVGIASGIGTFLSVFMVRLGASDFQVGLITAMPALTGMLFALPIGQFLERQRNIVPWYSRARFYVLTSYVLTGLVPFFFKDNAPAAIIVIWAIATIPQTIVNVAFTVVMGGVAGPHRRFWLMSRRWSSLGFTNAMVVFAAGQFLGHTDGNFPINYQILFIVSWLGGLISLYYSSHITLPDQVPVVREKQPRVPLRQRLAAASATFRDNPLFSKFIVSQFMFRWGLTFAVPLLPLYWVRTLGLSDGSIGTINTMYNGVLIVAYFTWGRLARKFGIRWVLLVSTAGFALYPLATALTGNVAVLIVFAAVAGFFLAGTDLVIFDVLLGTVPSDHQATYVGLYQTTNNMAMFFAPLVATTMAARVGIVPALVAAAGFRLAGFLMFYLLRVGYKAPAPTAQVTSSPAPARQ